MQYGQRVIAKANASHFAFVARLERCGVAQQVEVDRTTVFRWRKERRFAAEFAHQRDVMLQRTTMRVQSMLEPALDIIQRQLSGDDPKSSLRAAALLLRIASPSRHQRPAEDPRPDSQRTSGSSHFKKLMAFINAPMPNDPTYESYMARLRGEAPGDEDDDDHDE